MRDDEFSFPNQHWVNFEARSVEDMVAQIDIVIEKQEATQFGKAIRAHFLLRKRLVEVFMGLAIGEMEEPIKEKDYDWDNLLNQITSEDFEKTMKIIEEVLKPGKNNILDVIWKSDGNISKAQKTETE